MWNVSCSFDPLWGSSGQQRRHTWESFCDHRLDPFVSVFALSQGWERATCWQSSWSYIWGFPLSTLSHCRPRSWTSCCAAVSNCLTWRNTQRKLRRTLLVRLHAATRPCSTTAFLSASAPSCPSGEPPSEGYCQAWRSELCVRLWLL